MQQALSTARQQFEKRFGVGGRTRIIRSPGRVNLIGEHVDYNDGVVLPMAIEPEVYVVCRARADSVVSIASTAFDGQIDRIDLTQPIEKSPTQWMNYGRGVAALLIDAGIPLCGAELLIANTLPVGGGLSSSAAILVGIGLALLAAGGNSMNPDRLALLCQQAERTFAGVPCGIMDQTIVAGARAGHAMLLDCRDGSRHFVPLDPKELRVVIANTMLHHQLSDGDYEDRVKACRRGVEFFAASGAPVRSLRDVSVEMIRRAEGKLDEPTFRRCRHVVTEIARTVDAAELLGKRRYEEVGALMLESHESLRRDYEVSCAELDFYVDEAMKCRGVYGARMTGAGFGGCAVALVQPRAADALIDQLRQAFRARFNVEPSVFATAAAPAAGVVE